MASPQASQRLFSRQSMQMYDVDDDYSTAAVVPATVKDMSLYGRYGVLVMASALTGAGITKVEIVGSTGSDGTGSVTVIKDSGAVVGDAVGDYVALECSAEELRQEAEDAGAALRYLGVRLTLANAGDECVITVIRSDPRFAANALTATAIA